MKFEIPPINLNGRVYITGIGSSEAHGRYLEGLLERHTDISAKFLNIMDFYQEPF